MAYLGRWEIDDLLTFPANTHTAATGAATDADSVPSYRVYEDETGTAILTGSMAKLDDSNTVGFYSEQITLSAANGFEVGKSYTIYISATVATVVGTMAHTFQVEAAQATASAVVALQTSVDDLPTNAELATALGTADDATLAAIAALNNLSAAQVNAEVDTALSDYDGPTKAELDSGLALLATQASVNDLPTNSELATALGDLPTAVEVADAVLTRGVDNVEDTADTHSVAAMILAMFESAVVGTTWTIRKTGGTTFATKTIATDPDAEPIVSVT